MGRLPKSSPWAVEFVGMEFNPEKALVEKWCDQSSGNVQADAPTGKGLWAKRVDKIKRPPTLLYWFVLLVRLTPGGKIRSVREQMHQVFNDGHREIIDIPLFPPHTREAQEEMRKVIAQPAANIPSRRSKRSVGK